MAVEKCVGENCVVVEKCVVDHDEKYVVVEKCVVDGIPFSSFEFL